MKGCAVWLLLNLAQAPGAPPPAPLPSPDGESPPANAVVDNLGLHVSTPDGNNRLHLWFRAQFRYSYPFDGPPRNADGFQRPGVSSIDVRRARIKVGGNVYRSWLEYYLEYDVVTPTLLDLHFTFSKLTWLQLRVGQGKAFYNRERVDSSGRQQFVDRSIVNREFTLDRQSGVQVMGRLFPGSLADARYYVGVFNGNGINASNDDASMMWMARYQWQFLGRDLSFSQSDVEHRDAPAASLAFGTARNRSPFTRFSTGGAGQLDGFDPGDAGRYRLTQFVEEAALKYRGFSFQHELHWKKVEDGKTDAVTDLRGAYAQAGYLPWGGGGHPLAPLELAARWAWVDPDVALEDDARRELTFGANWFFSGHDNKLSFDVSRLTLERRGESALTDARVRIQWDVSF